jgi:hypothetical protein
MIKTRLPELQWKSCDMSYAFSVMDIMLAVGGSVLESGLKFGQPPCFKVQILTLQ